MSYYEDVYLARLNQHGTTRQERIQGTKEHQFEAFLEKSVYKVNFTSNYQNYIGSLQPASGDEKDVLSYLLTPIDVIISTGTILNVTTLKGESQKWLVTYHDGNTTHGYNKYKVYLLDRTMTWWDSNKVIHESPITISSSKDTNVQDIFKIIMREPVHREAHNLSNVIMAYDENLKQDYYCLLNGSPRSFIVSGFDCETVPGVQYVTLEITMLRDEESQIATPSSYWGG